MMDAHTNAQTVPATGSPARTITTTTPMTRCAQLTIRVYRGQLAESAEGLPGTSAAAQRSTLLTTPPVAAEARSR